LAQGNVCLSEVTCLPVDLFQ